MLYSLLYPLSNQLSFFNVFRYITFRSSLALLTALLLSLILGPCFIRFLQRIKFGQYIHEDVKLHGSKAGTPTMGGLFIAVCLVTSVLLWSDLSNPYIWLTLFVFCGFGLVGFMDDYLKVVRKQNKGISPRTKLLGQLFVSIPTLLLLFNLSDFTTILSFPFFKNLSLDLGSFYIPFAALVMIGTSNAVNLTDGLDGLAIGPMVIAGICFSIFVYTCGNNFFAQYLHLQYLPRVGEVTVFCAALVGASLGFLWYNAYPAQMFMGDVGSLSLGGVLGFIAVLCKQEFMLLVVGGLFVAETLSVILQVSYFRYSGGKRIFRMAPLHHHFELKGVPESKIIIRFWILSAILGLVALSILKLR